VTQTTNRYPYKCLAGRDFYEHAFACLAESLNATVRLGEEVRGCTEENDEVRVETSNMTIRSRQVFDGRGLPPGSPAFEEARWRAVWVPQKFLGLCIRARKPVFDPERCTLMD
jgi:lycopene beta-cyclase